MSDHTTIMLSAMAVVLILYVVNQERKSGGVLMALGKKKPRAVLGSKNKNSRRAEFKGCENVSIDHPDFARCATLGAGRAVIPVDPKTRTANINTSFVKDNFAPVGNPFAKSLDDDFVKDGFLGTSKVEDSVLPISKAGSEAFPFAGKGSERDLGMKAEKDYQTKTLGMKSEFKVVKQSETPAGGMKFSAPKTRTARDLVDNEAPPQAVVRSTLTLGAAVAPSASLGMGQEEIEQAANRLENVDIVQRTNGGQLNLLIHS